MNKTYSIWGREVTLEIEFEKFSEDEKPTDGQLALLQEFDANPQPYFEKAYKAIEDHCKVYFSNEMEFPLTDIYQYMTPSIIFIDQGLGCDACALGLICKFTLDDENNMAVKFMNGEVKDVGGDFILA